MRAIGLNEFPGGVRIKYTAGFEKDKIPAAVVSLVENTAAYNLQSIIGPVIFPANTVGISIDGVSQSTGTQGPAFLKERMATLETIIEKQKTVVKGYYQRAFQIDVF